MKKRPARHASPRRPTVALVSQALNLAVQDAIEEYRRAGELLVVWEDGRVAHVPPPPAKSSANASRTRPAANRKK